MAEKSRDERDADREFRRTIHRNDAIASVLHRAIPWGAAIGVTYLWTEAIVNIAGTHTLADIAIRIVQEYKIADAICIGLAVGGITYGIRQRKLRKDATERLSTRQQELERRIDPDRTSSQLTPRGTSRPEDVP